MYLARLASGTKFSKKTSQQQQEKSSLILTNNQQQQQSNTNNKKDANNQNHKNIKTIENIFEEASYNGILNLNDKKLKEYPRINQYYNLIDTININLTNNQLVEIAKEICLYESLEILILDKNNIKLIPDCIFKLKCLKILNLNNNQLNYLPSSICLLESLEILLINNNKLVSLPEEINKLNKLIQLDVSYNQIQHLPVQIGDLNKLRILNIRRNLLVELPNQISMLNSLIIFDCSFNRLTKLPLTFFDLVTLIDLNVDNNPLECPPASVIFYLLFLINFSIKCFESSRGNVKFCVDQAFSQNSFITIMIVILMLKNYQHKTSTYHR